MEITVNIESIEQEIKSLEETIREMMADIQFATNASLITLHSGITLNFDKAVMTTEFSQGVVTVFVELPNVAFSHGECQSGFDGDDLAGVYSVAQQLTSFNKGALAKDLVALNDAINALKPLRKELLRLQTLAESAQREAVASELKAYAGLEYFRPFYFPGENPKKYVVSIQSERDKDLKVMVSVYENVFSERNLHYVNGKIVAKHNVNIAMGDTSKPWYVFSMFNELVGLSDAQKQALDKLAGIDGVRYDDLIGALKA